MFLPFHFQPRFEWSELGRTACFCPICSDATPHRLRERLEGVSVVILYAIKLPLGSTKAIGTWSKCERCSTNQPASPDAAPTDLGPDASLDDLLAALPLEHVQEIEQHLAALEHAHAAASQNSPSRQQALEAPLRAVSAELRGQGWLVAQTVLAVLSLFVPAFILSEVMLRLNPRAQLGTPWFLPVVLCMMAVFYLSGRWCIEQTALLTRREPIRRAAHALAPLRPTQQEVTATIRRLRKQGVEICRRVRIAKLASLLRPDDSPSIAQKSTAA